MGTVRLSGIASAMPSGHCSIEEPPYATIRLIMPRSPSGKCRAKQERTIPNRPAAPARINSSAC